MVKKKYQAMVPHIFCYFEQKKKYLFSLREIFQVDFYPAKSPNWTIMHQCDEIVSFNANFKLFIT